MITTDLKRSLSALKGSAPPAPPPRSIYCERAAIIIMALDDERSERLLSQMSEDEIRRLAEPWRS
jgi:hypothetical protein